MAITKQVPEDKEIPWVDELLVFSMEQEKAIVSAMNKLFADNTRLYCSRHVRDKQKN